MRYGLWRFLVTGIVGIHLASCGSSGSSSSDSTSSMSLAGTWKTGCIAISSGIYVIVTNVNTDTQSDSSITYYTDSTCLFAKLVDTSYRTYKVGNAVAGLANTYEIDLTYSKVERTYKDSTEVAGANTDKGFGFSDWSINVAKEITGLKYSLTSSAQAKNGEISYYIFKLENSVYTPGDTSTGDGSTPATREKSLSTTLKQTKQ